MFSIKLPNRKLEKDYEGATLLNQWKWTDKLLLGLALIVGAAASYLLYDDSLLDQISMTNKAKIGRVEEVSKDVRRKLANNFVWKNIKQPTDLHQGDSLYTGAGSEATITLNNGSQLVLQENSLLTFVDKGNGLELNLKAGQAKTTDETVKINTAVVIKPKKVAVRPPTKKIIYQVQPPSKISHIESGVTLDFSWKAIDGNVIYRTQVSKSIDFQEMIENQISTETSFKSSRPLDIGKYYVRVIAESADGQRRGNSETKEVQVISALSPNWIQPTQDQKFSFQMNADGELLLPPRTTLQWDHPSNSFELQLATDAEFKNIYWKTNLKNYVIETKDLKAGTYYARVKETEIPNSPWSAILSFTVEYVKDNTFQAPILAATQIQTKLETPDVIQAEWQIVPGADRYLVEVSSDTSFSNSQKIETKQTYHRINKEGIGTQYFRVSAITKKGNRSPATIGQVLVSTDPPILSPVENFKLETKNILDKTPGQNFSLKWQAPTPAPLYQLEIARDPQFTSVVEQKSISDLQYNFIGNQLGEYYARVRSLKADQTPMTGFSNIQNFNYDMNILIDTPKLVEPTASLAVYLKDNTTPYIWFEWTAVANAENYLLEIASDADFQKLVVKRTVKSTRWLSKDLASLGTFHWRVKAKVGKQFESKWSDARIFKMMPESAAPRLPASQKGEKSGK